MTKTRLENVCYRFGWDRHMYLKRKADAFLVDWLNDSDRKPLVMKGARQTGKTRTIRQFVESHYENVIYINFVEEPKYKGITQKGYSTQDVVSSISLLNPRWTFPEHKTIFFFDEVQDHIDLLTSLKFFHLDGRYDVICSGSMLGLQYQQINSVSVGYKTDYTMRSLDFEEFLWAKGYPESIAVMLLESMISKTPFTESELHPFDSLFHEYIILGGMPEVVSKAIALQTFEGSLSRQIQILNDYRDDMKKYAMGLDKAKILSVFKHIPIQLARENKKFQWTKMDSNARLRDYVGVVDWLSDAGLNHLCYALHDLSLPLKGNHDSSKLKIYMQDPGLFVAMLDEESQDDLRANRNLGVYKGGLYESIVADAFVKSGLDLYYYKNASSTLELDFLVRSKRFLVPVEVKSKDGNGKSLRAVLDSIKYPDISFGIKLANRNIGVSGNIETFPLFLAFLIKTYLAKRTR